MFLFDMPLDQLRECRLPITREPDFDAYWQRHLDRSDAQPLEIERAPIDYPVREVLVEDLTFAAYDGGRIAAWFIAPADTACDARPALVFYHGYSGHKGRIANYLGWALQGFACLIIDVRGQSGDSADWARYPGGHATGWLTMGILEPDSYYLLRCYMDAVRAVAVARSLPGVDAARVGVLGCSQGGGLSLAAAALQPDVSVCMAEVPAFCHFGRTFAITKAAPWTELITYFQYHPDRIEQAMRTLSYVELNSLAERIVCPALINVGLQDELCVPSSIFSVYNRLTSKTKYLDVFPCNGHEGNMSIERMTVWARTHLRQD